MKCAGLRRFLGYVCVGAAGTAVQYVVFVVLISIHAIGAMAASSVGAIAGAIINYGLNYRFTFRSTGPHSRTASRFLAVAAVSVGVNGTFMFVLMHRLGVSWLPAQCVTTLGVLAFTYTANSLWTFGVNRT
jgi:putative flippase GtrA